METRRTNPYTLSLFFLIILAVNTFAEVTPDSSLEEYNNAKERIDELSSKGYPTLPLIDSLEEARVAHNLQNYILSIETSKNILAKSDEIIQTAKSLDDITDTLGVLQSFGYDTTPLDVKLIYAKSDFEAANIDLSIQEKDELIFSLNKILSNLSAGYMESLNGYYNGLDNGSKEDFLMEFYNQEKEYYLNKEYTNFLSGLRSLDDIKRILEELYNLRKNKETLNKKNISFNREKDMLSLYSLHLTDKKYLDALSDIEGLNNLSKTAIFIIDEKETLDNNFKRLEAQGIIDEKTKETYLSIEKEFLLENYENAKESLLKTKESLISIERQNLILGGINRAALKKGFKDFIKNYWEYILIAGILISILFKPTKSYIMLRYLKKKLLVQKDEIDAIISLQKDLQKDYFISHSIDNKSYKGENQRYEERKMDLQNKIALLEDDINTNTKYLEKIEKYLPWKDKKR